MKNRDYRHIITLPHHTSKKHSHMPVPDRAAQFAPFAALTGYESAIGETARLTEERIELDEYEKSVISDKINFLQTMLPSSPIITVTYFIEDEKKQGGKYVSWESAVKKIDGQRRTITLEDAGEISIDDIIAISGDVPGESEDRSINTKK